MEAIVPKGIITPNPSEDEDDSQLDLPPRKRLYVRDPQTFTPPPFHSTENFFSDDEDASKLSVAEDIHKKIEQVVDNLIADNERVLAQTYMAVPLSCTPPSVSSPPPRASVIMRANRDGTCTAAPLDLCTKYENPDPSENVFRSFKYKIGRRSFSEDSSSSSSLTSSSVASVQVKEAPPMTPPPSHVSSLSTSPSLLEQELMPPPPPPPPHPPPQVTQ